eukprot:CAMPEP_0182417232 /NCGR_PEP_ID=MMETSP1167-20130531/1663_1 /TAXON_ID=2988 /ORGANISM="Mallomonas Sp, Strain CCMP3275" /LENGTH=265 /DNA_ID=CAMNT_0024590641 /DNA_START=41 /DNA_END=838 /DNA_ORIENTATION=+
MIRAIAVLSGILAVVSAGAPSKSGVSVAIKEDNIGGGMEDLDLNWAGVFKMNGYSLGFKYALNAIRDKPETIFAKKSFDTMGDGVLTVDTEYNLPKNAFSLLSTWASSAKGFCASALIDSKDKLTKLAMNKNTADFLGGDMVKFSAEFEPKKDSKVSLSGSYAKGDTAVKLEVDSVDKDTLLTVAHNMNEYTLSPEISLKTGDIAYGVKRNVEGGSISAHLKVNEKLTVKWTDEATTGAWVAKAIVPLDDDKKKTRFSVSRDWNL